MADDLLALSAKSKLADFEGKYPAVFQQEKTFCKVKNPGVVISGPPQLKYGKRKSEKAPFHTCLPSPPTPHLAVWLLGKPALVAVLRIHSLVFLQSEI